MSSLLFVKEPIEESMEFMRDSPEPKCEDCPNNGDCDGICLAKNEKAEEKEEEKKDMVKAEEKKEEKVEDKKEMVKAEEKKEVMKAEEKKEKKEKKEEKKEEQVKMENVIKSEDIIEQVEKVISECVVLLEERTEEKVEEKEPVPAKSFSFASYISNWFFPCK